MRIHTAAAIAAGLLLAVTGCSSDTTYTADDCAAAITDSSTKTDRPAECADVSDDDYETLITAYIIKKNGLGS